jgi:hypothetical protein
MVLMSYSKEQAGALRRLLLAVLAGALVAFVVAPLVSLALPERGISLTAIERNYGRELGGETVTVRGSGLSQPNGESLNQLALMGDASQDATLTAVPDVSFGGVPATDVVVIDDETLTCTVPAGTVGRVDVTVTIDDVTVNRPQFYEYIPAVDIAYDNYTCSTCHYGDLHKEHQRPSCTACHSTSVNKGMPQVARITDWSQNVRVASRQSCGVDAAGCHLNGITAGTGKQWHGYRLEDMTKAHVLADDMTSCGGSDCHRSGSGTTPFFFGEMNLAQAHRDYAQAFSVDRVSPDAEVAADIKAGGCAVCHDRASNDPKKLKDFVRDVKASEGFDITCASCHNNNGASYMPGQTQCLTTSRSNDFSGLPFAAPAGSSDVQDLLSSLSPQTKLYFPQESLIEPLKPQALSGLSLQLSP